MALLDVLLDSERRAEAARVQASLQEKHGHRIIDDAARANYVFGQARERVTLNLISAYNNPLIWIHRSQFNWLYDQLADAYAEQGRFLEAADNAVSEPHRRDYEAKARAVQKIGIRLCECPTTISVPSKTDARGTPQQTLGPAQEIWDGTRLIKLRKCLRCGTISANV